MTDDPRFLTLICVGCGKTPSELDEYVDAAEMVNAEEPGVWPPTTPEEYVLHEEGTLNPENGHFACSPCYIAMGQPSAPIGRWVAP